MINDINRHNDENLGGAHSYKFIPVEGVKEIPKVLNLQIHHQVILNPGAKWFDGYGTEGSMGFKDKQQDSDHGNFHAKSFVAKIPKERADVMDTLNSSRNKKFILDILMNNGTRILAGTIEEPLTFVGDYDSKNQVAEYNGFEVLFSGNCEHRSPIYNV